MGNVKHTANAYKPKKKLSSVVAKQNAKSQVVKRVADASKIAAAIAKTTASKVIQPAETLSGEAKMADNLALKSLENEVSFLRAREAYLTAKGNELLDLVAS
jgi:hypothetical protein